MKKLFFLMIITVVAGACTKASGDGSLTGKWKLFQTLADPGDGSGTWKNVSDGITLEFKANGSIVDPDRQMASYKIIDDTKLQIGTADTSVYDLSYKVEGDLLTLRPMCIEACGSKYARIK